MAQAQQRLRIVGIFLQDIGELDARDVVPRFVQIVKGPNQAFLRSGLGRIQFGIAQQVRNARAGAGVVLKVLRHQIVVLALQRAQMLLHREHRFGVEAAARHQKQAVLVGLQFVGARDLREGARLQNISEVVDERREQRSNSEEQIEQLRFILHRHCVPALDMSRFVADDAGQFVVGLHEVEQSLVHVDETAQCRERVDVVLVQNFDAIRNVLTRGLRPELA